MMKRNNRIVKFKGYTKFKGRLSCIVFCGGILLGSIYKFEINQSNYLLEIIGVAIVLFLVCIAPMTLYLEDLKNGEDY